MILSSWAPALALDVRLDVSQYAHTSWKISEGFSEGFIRSIAQTADGYLWLGTEFGLRRFDGVRAVPWEPPAGQHLPSSDIRSLKGARDGHLWIGTFRGLASWKDGKLTHYPELDGQIIEALLEDREGTIWVAGWTPSVGRLCRIQSGNTECYGQDGRFDSGVTALYEDRGGNLWAGAMNGLWRWKPGPPKLFPMPDPTQRIYALLESDDGGLLIAQHTGITKLRKGEFEPYRLPAGFQPHRLLRDRDGGVWIGALVDKGLLHVHEGKTDLFTPAEGLSDGSVDALFEDREGNIWVPTDDGLDRFREFAVPTISIQQGLSSRGISSIVVARDGSLWVGASDGLNRWMNGQIKVYRKDSGLPDKAHALFQDASGTLWVGTQSGIVFLESDRFVPVASVPYGIVYSFTDDGAGNVWVSHQKGLLHLFGARVGELIPWARLGRAEPAFALLHDAVQGGLWLGFLDGGVVYFKDGQLRASYANAAGLGQGMVRDFYIDGNGTLWAATEGGLSRIEDGRVLTLTSQNGLPCDTVHWMREDASHSVWLYLACGLVRIGRSELDSWASHPKQTIHATVFDNSDGVSSHRFTGGYNSVVATPADGTLWFVRDVGVSVIDPRHLSINTLPPPVHIEQVTADGKVYDATNGLRLPARMRNLAIDYTALSFVAPEKVRFRYTLEGQNRNWHEVINDRQIQYTNLAPGPYRFRVIASNNSGVWNETGATLEFSIAPAYYQTRWFQALVVASAVGLVWAGYRGRVRQVARQYQQRLDERVNERTRIARELHDTLLQSFHGLLLQFQTVAYLLPDRPAEAREKLDGAIVHAAKAITEGRDAVQGLRVSTIERNDLAIAIRILGDSLGSDAKASKRPDFTVAVEGETRDLHPIVRDEIYKIGAEALRNAFRHAQAGRIEAEIHYDDEQFRLRVRDDGTGIDPEVLANQGSEGHYGLRGMPERAAVIGGELAVWSEVGAGTEVELRLPRPQSLRETREAFVAAAGVGLEGVRTKENVMSPGSSPIRILAVDDHPVVRQGIAGLVGVQPDMTIVAEAATGREAIQQFRAHRPDVTLMDIQMPEMNGLDALITIRTEFPDAKVIVLTTYEGDAHILRALKAGALGYLLKNTLHSELLQTIRVVHAGRRSLSSEASFQVAQHMGDQTLTPAELVVLRLIAEGNANKQIADQLGITEDTVKGRVKSILAKLDANDRTHAAIIGVKRGIIEVLTLKSHPHRPTGGSRWRRHAK
jgi:DNA-binding NarL/FixJ family response regulator/signal transduction histidine kinase/ligand-binding sensor domain-containing protein